MVLGIEFPPSKCVSIFGKGQVFVLDERCFQVRDLTWTPYPKAWGWQHFLVLNEHWLLVPWVLSNTVVLFSEVYLLGIQTIHLIRRFSLTSGTHNLHSLKTWRLLAPWREWGRQAPLGRKMGDRQPSPHHWPGQDRGTQVTFTLHLPQGKCLFLLEVLHSPASGRCHLPLHDEYGRARERMKTGCVLDELVAYCLTTLLSF